MQDNTHATVNTNVQDTVLSSQYWCELRDDYYQPLSKDFSLKDMKAIVFKIRKEIVFFHLEHGLARRRKEWKGWVCECLNGVCVSIRSQCQAPFYFFLPCF